MALLQSRAYRGEMPELVASSTLPQRSRVVRCQAARDLVTSSEPKVVRRAAAQALVHLLDEIDALGCPEELESLTYRAFLEVLRAVNRKTWTMLCSMEDGKVFFEKRNSNGVDWSATQKMKLEDHFADCFPLTALCPAGCFG